MKPLSGPHSIKSAIAAERLFGSLLHLCVVIAQSVIVRFALDRNSWSVLARFACMQITGAQIAVEPTF